MSHHCTRGVGAAAAAAAGALFAAAAPAGEIEVIFSEAPGHPTAAVPGAVALDGTPIDVEFKALEILSLSPDGAQWLLRGRNHGGSDIETMLLLGSGVDGTVIAQEGQPVPGGAPGEVVDFFGSSPPHFNEVGQFVFTARARGGDPSVKQKGILFDGDAYVVIRAESDPAAGLMDLTPNPSGDELFGNSFGSMHVLNDGTVGSHDGTLQNIHSSRPSALFYDDQAFRQSSVSLIGPDIWLDFDSNAFWTTLDGTSYIALGEDSAGVIVVVDDVVQLREGEEIAGSGVVFDDAFHVEILADGTWLARGDEASGADWAVRGGVVVAATGEPVVPGRDEAWGDVITAIAGNRVGGYAVAGSTDAADEATNAVIVLDGAEVIIREGDPVDLDGNGAFDDDAFIGRGNLTSSPFHPDDMALTDDGVLYLLTSLRDGAGMDLGTFGTGGDALLRLDTTDDVPCPADTDGSGEVDVDDLVAVILAWGTDDPDADVDDSGSVDVDDLVLVILAWGPCAPG